MLQFFEAHLLGLFRALFGLPPIWGVLTFGLVGAVLLGIQFLKRKDTFIPGIFGLLSLAVVGIHILASEAAIVRLDSWINAITSGHAEREPIFLLEPIFSIFVAPIEHRYLFEESLFLLIVGWIISATMLGWKEYKTSGKLFGEFSMGSLFETHKKRPQRSDSNELGSGNLADNQQILNWTKLSGNADTILPVTDLTGNQGIALKQGDLVIPSDYRNRHVLIIAKTGSGKTTKLILPVLYSDCMCKQRSTIVIDSKPEMWRKLAAMTRKYNPEKEIMLFNPLDRARSLSWNILSKIENDTDCKLIANTIIMATDQPGSKGDSPFFKNNALSVLNALMVGLLNDGNDRLSMPRIHELVQSGNKNLCDWIEAHPQSIRTSRAFVDLVRSGSQNADTIMSELSMRLSAWDLTAIRATTYFDELDLENLVKKPTLFIVELRESEIEMLRPLANVMVIEILRYLTKRAESCPGVSLPRPVSLVIDEFASALGRLPDIHVKLNTLRSRNVSIVAAIQSIAQVKANYADDADSVLAGFSTKIFMPALDLTDSEFASKETGQMTIRFKTASAGSNKKLTEVFASKNDGTQEQVQQRAVLTPDEIGRPADNISTFFMPGTPVFQGHLVPYYKVPETVQRIKEFDADEKELRLRDKPIELIEKDPAPPAAAAGGAPAAGAAPGLPPGISNTKGWTDDQVKTKLEETKKTLDWENTTGSAKKWWEAFENENQQRSALVLRLAEELAVRKATITEFFLAYVYSNTDNIQANLHYLDYTRLKKEEEKRKREAAQQQGQPAVGTPTGAGAPPGGAANQQAA